MSYGSHYTSSPGLLCPPYDFYGGFDLKRGDRDGNPSATAAAQQPVYGGKQNPPIPVRSTLTPSNQGTSVSTPEFVQDLQRLLRELGFLVIRGAANGDIVVDGDDGPGRFGMTTEWAVREFQIYASMTHVAKLNVERLRRFTSDPNAGESAWQVAARGQLPNSVTLDPNLDAEVTPHPVSYYVATLDQKENIYLYKGPISGVVNQETRNAIWIWWILRYRCPVVVEAWLHNSAGVRTTIFNNGVNIWHYKEINSYSPRMFFRDFTNYYTYPNTKPSNEYHVLGTWEKYTPQNEEGPNSEVPKHTWGMNGQGTEIMPENLINAGTTLTSLQQNLNGATASTFRVTRAVSEMECMGCFDSVNAYDIAVASIGPCHWTFALAPVNNLHQDGELSAFLAFFRDRYADDFQRAVGNFGLFPKESWTARASTPPRGTGSTMWHNGQRKYAGWYQAYSTDETLKDIKKTQKEVNYYRCWHWFFRWVMAGRTIQNYRYAMWDMFRMRIQDVRDIEVNVTATIPQPNVPSHPQASGQQQTNTTINVQGSLGQIFTSEKGVAFITRVHILGPGFVTGTTTRDAIKNAIERNPTLNWSQPLNQWRDEEEIALCETLLASFPTRPDFTLTLRQVDAWPNYPGRDTGSKKRDYFLRAELGNIRSGRNSFVFDTSGI